MRFKKNDFGFEIASRTGFNGPLNLSEEIQSSIEGPAPTVLSTPNLELLVTMMNVLGESQLHTIVKLGLDFNYIKFDRYDLHSLKVCNFLSYVGFGYGLIEKINIYVVVGGEKQLFKSNLYGFLINPPRSNRIVSFGFTKSF